VPSRLVNRNITADRGRTSMRLEPELWAALNEICAREQITLGDLVRQIERRGHPGGRTSAVRVHIVDYFRIIAGEPGKGAEEGCMTAAGGERNGEQPHAARGLA
jgi:predicted DNA-binding ribbon-helix-helix protein